MGAILLCLVPGGGPACLTLQAVVSPGTYFRMYGDVTFQKRQAA